jgi:hypothetical protein
MDRLGNNYMTGTYSASNTTYAEVIRVGGPKVT